MRLVIAQNPARDRLAMDLVGPVVEPRGARVAVHRLQRQVGRVAERAVDLQRAVDDVEEHVGAEELDQRDVRAGGAGALVVHPPGGVQRHQPRGLHLRRGVRDPVLDRLLVARAPSRRRSATRARSQSMSNARCDTPSQRMQWWMRPGPSRCWAIRKPSPSLPSSCVGGDADVLVVDLGVAAVAAEVLGRVLHRRDVADDVHARRVDVDDDHRGALVRPRVGVGDRHHDQEVGDGAVGREPLVAVDDVVVAVAAPRASAAAWDRSPPCPARSSRTRCAGRPPAAGAGSAPSGPACPPCARISLLPLSGAALPNTAGANGERCRGSRASARA